MNLKSMIISRKRCSKRLRRFVTMISAFNPAAGRSRRQSSPRLTAPVSVWDVKLGAFRSVDLYNLHDPLWEPAKELAIQIELARQTRTTPRPGVPDLATRYEPETETRGRLASNAPRSPFGGSSLVAGGADISTEFLAVGSQDQ